MLLTCCLIFGVIIFSLILISYILTSRRNAAITEMMLSAEFDDEGDEGPRSKIFRDMWRLGNYGYSPYVPNLLSSYNTNPFYGFNRYANGFPSFYNPGAPNEHMRARKRGAEKRNLKESSDLTEYLMHRLDDISKEIKKSKMFANSVEKLTSPQANKKYDAQCEKIRNLKAEENKIKSFLSYKNL